MKEKNQKQRRIPERRCVGCGESFPKRELIRIVRTPEGEVTIDFTGRKNGRGAYLCMSLACFKKARKSGRISKALETPITDELYEILEKEVAVSEADKDKI